MAPPPPTMAHPALRLRPAALADVPRLAHIADIAFRADRHTQLHALPPDGYRHGQTMAQLLRRWMGPEAGACQVLTAVVDDTVVGWICWGQHGLSAAERARLIVPPDTQSSGAMADEDDDSDDDPDSDAEVESTTDPRRQLRELTSRDMQRWMDRLMPPATKRLFIKSVAVDPAWQRRGVGRALIRAGTHVADALAVDCWIHTAEAAAPLAAQEGFVEVGRLAVDLDRFAHVAPPPEMGLLRDGQRIWGEYVFRYMQRAAVAT